ncbi:ASCH domain-containing protein [Paenibacillus melissococcoides]|uniref:ASCH domain-containing protein n=2 Tax=Paenibacillus TaxID=44249 RepID=A0ABN8UFW1_9BACL|nr:ASCH domain-containing protein [Bacillus cereus]CAH8248603.1 ASCH domain-containing protein [Paenibacillus melissococcoides]CAH8714276.1 ASCH domain-containing protein [Paenibacillus melissococcoides]CAH8719957.1 ASCH domain-containing protein [Paenibacillus melissococcoides]
MKAITIIQPWATLIAIGAKRFETRSWATTHRGPIAIHAGKKIDRDAYMSEQIYSTLQKHGIMFIDDLPTGAVVAVCTLSECWRIRRTEGDNEGPVWLDNAGGQTLGWGGVYPLEYHFGDYTHGRFAWELKEIKRLPEPLSAKGQQGLWNWQP